MSRAPAGPTKGFPARSSTSPGCSPTSIISAWSGPTPGTPCVASRHRSHRRHAFSALAIAGRLSSPAGEVSVSTGAGARRRAGVVGAVSTMVVILRSASSIRLGMSAASGRLRQYCFGISEVMARTLSRAGLKMEA